MQMSHCHQQYFNQAVIPELPSVSEALTSMILHVPHRMPPHRLSPILSLTDDTADLQKMGETYPDGLPLLDPVEDMNIRDDPELIAAVEQINRLEQQLVKNPGGLFACKVCGR